MVNAAYEIILQSPMDILPSIKMEQISDFSLNSSVYAHEIYPGKRCGRKRALDHLTLEERILRKKLKNREAAQTSRDKKKARMEELEKSVNQLEKMNKRLQEEMEALRTEKDDIRKENEKLREELKQHAGINRALEYFVGSAEFAINPLPKGHHSSRTLPVVIVQVLRIMFYLMIWMSWTGYFRVNFRHWIVYSWIKSVVLARAHFHKKLNKPMTKWWGKHQRNWNPIYRTYLPILLI